MGMALHRDWKKLAIQSSRIGPVCHMHRLRIVAVRGYAVHGIEDRLHGLGGTETAVVVVSPGSHIEVMVHFGMDGIHNIESVGIDNARWVEV